LHVFSPEIEKYNVIEIYIILSLTLTFMTLIPTPHNNHPHTSNNAIHTWLAASYKALKASSDAAEQSALLLRSDTHAPDCSTFTCFAEYGSRSVRHRWEQEEQPQSQS